ncbi:hypothetical protein CDAR_7201, partial [Caerostris darwini]
NYKITNRTQLPKNELFISSVIWKARLSTGSPLRSFGMKMAWDHFSSDPK